MVVVGAAQGVGVVGVRVERKADQVVAREHGVVNAVAVEVVANDEGRVAPGPFAGFVARVFTEHAHGRRIKSSGHEDPVSADFLLPKSRQVRQQSLPAAQRIMDIRIDQARCAGGCGEGDRAVRSGRWCHGVSRNGPKTETVPLMFTRPCATARTAILFDLPVASGRWGHG